MLKEKSMSKQEKYMDWDNMNSRLEALFVLDNALTESEDEDIRLVRKYEDKETVKYIVDNGVGDILTVIFSETAVLVKGFAHENSLNQYAADEWNHSIIDKMYYGLDEKLKNLFTDDEMKETEIQKSNILLLRTYRVTAKHCLLKLLLKL